MSVSPLKIVKASAGSGKTFTLALQYLTLIFLNPQNFQRILAVTFTNKATDEMKERILSVLRNLANPEGNLQFNPYRKKLLEYLTDETVNSLQIKADELYREIIHNYHRFSVTTIDKFMQKVIRSFAFELGLDSQFALEMNINKVNEELIKQLDEQLPNRPELMKSLYSYVLHQIENGKNWNYRGKLKEFTQELFKETYSIYEQSIVQFESVEQLQLALDTLTKIADQYIQNFEQQLTNFSEKATQIFHENEIEPDYLAGKSKSGLPKLKSLTPNTNFESILKYLDPEVPWFQKNQDFPKFQSAIEKLLVQLEHFLRENTKNYILSTRVRNHFNYINFIQELSVLLQNYRRDTRKLLITDTTKILNGIIEDNNNPAFVWERTGQQYQYFLFDEFQDTSKSQWRSFIPLLENVLNKSPKKVDNTHHLIVGDVKQAIYRWRNGDWSILHRQAQSQFNQQVQIESLQDNRRSCKNIIDFNNHIYNHLPRVLQTRLNDFVSACTPKVREWWHQTKFETIIENVYNDAAQNFPENTSPEKNGGTVKFTMYDSTSVNDENLEELTDGLVQLIEEIQTLHTNRNYPLADIAVLVRTHAQAAKIVNTLLDNGIPVISGDALKIAQNEGVKLIISLLQGIFYAPKYQGLFWAEAAWLYAKLHQKSYDASTWLYFNSFEISKAHHIFPAAFCHHFESWKAMSSNALLEQIIRTFELDTLPEHQLYLLRLRDHLEQINSNGDKGIVYFLDWWYKEGVEKNLPEMADVDAVQVITIHKSKGLDFKAVFIPFCDWPIAGNDNTFMADMSETPFKILQFMPIKAYQGLVNTDIAKSYLEELMYSFMDALNMLYVATTRSVDYLHIMVKSKKDYDNFSNIGHALSHVLKKFPIHEQDWTDENHYAIDDKKILTPMASDAQSNLKISNPKIENQFDKYFNTPVKKSVYRNQKIKDYSREGTIMHEILSQCNRVKDIENCIQKLKLVYQLTVEEQKKFTIQAQNILENPTLKPLFASAEILSEQSILCADGKTIRPDKIMIRPDQTAIVLDYKFTQEESSEHFAQIKNYKSQLISMGYLKVESYLYYYKNNQLELVD